MLRLALALGFTWLIWVRWQGASPETLGLTRRGRPGWGALADAGAGVASALLAFGIAWAAGGYVVSAATPSAAWPALFAVALAVLAGSAFEEIAFRGALVGPLAGLMPPALAMLIPGVLFALAHAGNDSASAAGILNIVLAGLLLGLLFLDAPFAGGARSIVFCSTWHFGWNFAVGLLGVPVSGNVPDAPLVTSQPLDGTWSGGAFGLEASPATSVVWLAASIALLVRHALRARSRAAAPEGPAAEKPPMKDGASADAPAP